MQTIVFIFLFSVYPIYSELNDIAPIPKNNKWDRF